MISPVTEWHQDGVTEATIKPLVTNKTKNIWFTLRLLLALKVKVGRKFSRGDGEEYISDERYSDTVGWQKPLSVHYGIGSFCFGS